MVSLDRRTAIAALIGEAPERLVYTYCACDRAVTWPTIKDGELAVFRDRFTGAERRIGGAELCAFCELTCANEIEIATSDAGFAALHGAALLAHFTGWRAWLTTSALLEAERVLSGVRTPGDVEAPPASR